MEQDGTSVEGAAHNNAREQVTLEAQSIQATMLMPLWGRADGSRICPEILSDPVALRMIDRLDYDFSDIARSYGEYGSVCCAVRARRLDDFIKAYLVGHPRASVVNIGAGLDTTFERVDNGQLHFYNLDLPDAAAYRLGLMPDSERCTTIAQSWLDHSWMDEIEYIPSEGIVFIAGGVFYYLEEADVRRTVAEMARRFTGGRLFYDGCSKSGVKIANNKVRKAGNTGAQMHYYVKSEKDIRGWSEHISEAIVSPFFKGIQRQREWEAATKLSMFFGDALRMVYMLEIRFG
jgi:O-methyltransferase involved in polyketide biosynthesis